MACEWDGCTPQTECETCDSLHYVFEADVIRSVALTLYSLPTDTGGIYHRNDVAKALAALAKTYKENNDAA
jgi:hypothetical protein